MNLDWSFFCQDTVTLETVKGCFAATGEQTYLDWLIQAWGWTALVSINSLILALLCGLVIGTLRSMKSCRICQVVGSVWVELFRNIPILVQIFLWYFVVPALIPAFKALPGYVLVVFALGFFTSARIAEQVRSGIASLPSGQMAAASALGFTTMQTYRYVILPQAMRLILPPLTSESMGIVKNSSVAFAVSIAELTLYAQQVQEETARGIEVYLAVTVLYVITALVIFFIMAWIERLVRIPGWHNGGQGK